MPKKEKSKKDIYMYKIMCVKYIACVWLQFGLLPISLALLFSISTGDEKQNKNFFFNCVWINLHRKQE